MLHKSFRSVITRWLLKKNKYIINIEHYCTVTNNSHLDSKRTEILNIARMKKEIDRIKSKKLKKKLLDDKEIFEFVSYIQKVKPDIINTGSKSLMSIGGRDINVLYFVDRQAAAEFISMIIKDLSKNMCFVAELNPGFGILTTELLKANVPMIHLYEARSQFHPMLNKLSKNHPGKLDLRNFNLLKISQLLYFDKENDENQVAEVLQGLKTTKWEDETCLQVIGATGTSIFFRHMVYSLLFRNGLMSYGRPVFYFAIPPSLWHRYTGENDRCTIRKVMFKLMFNYEVLGSLNRKAFLPWPRKKKQKEHSKKLKLETELIDYNEIYVVKFEPKADAYSCFSQKDWIIFWYFVRQNLYKPSKKVIPELEKWIPGCGVRLIAKDYTIFTQFGDLTPEQLLKLFKEFKLFPEYETCNFLTSMKNTFNMHHESALLEFYKEDEKNN